MVLLETIKLDKWFGGLHVTGGVDFQLDEGEVHCLVGPNGAGKSTFFNLLLGSLTPNSGHIFFQGKDITKKSSYQRVRDGISVKFQVPGIFAEMSVRQNLQVSYQRAHKNNAELQGKIDQLLKFLNLTAHQDKLAGNLSHGQKQWLEIGMAVSLEPVLLLLDEPTAGMTPDETEQTGQMILDLNKQGVTVLAVEHDMGFVRQIADHVTVLNYGKIFASGSISDIEQDERVIEIYLGKSNG